MVMVISVNYSAWCDFFHISFTCVGKYLVTARDLRVIGLSELGGLGRDAEKGTYFTVTAIISSLKADGALYKARMHFMFLFITLRRWCNDGAVLTLKYCGLKPVDKNKALCYSGC